MPESPPRKRIPPARLIEAMPHYDNLGRPTKTRTKVVCECGEPRYVYNWSWAGHGFFVCKECGVEVTYLGG